MEKMGKGNPFIKKENRRAGVYAILLFSFGRNVKKDKARGRDRLL